MEINNIVELATTVRDGVVFVDFMTTWCAPCMRFLSIADRFQEALPVDVKFLTVDIDKVPEVKDVYEITKIPTFLIFKDGIEKYRQEGSFTTIAELVAQTVKVQTI